MKSSKFNVRSPAQRGIALIVTLVMLSIITFMAVTFLVLSHRERNAVSTATDQTVARFAAESGRERALSELTARILAFTNDKAIGVLVSTNYINWNGFNPAAADPTNVNYAYTISGAALNAQQLQQNIANLWFDPRPPVVVSNYMSGLNEFRYYLDVNRNGRYDTNGWWPVMSDDLALPFYDASGNLTGVSNLAVYANFIGDPEWIGVLTRPDQPHSGSNYFVSRYAYFVQPAGRTLDANAIHNQAVTRALNPGGDGYMRNQGVGSWELNLAAFLADLNTNYWYLPRPIYPSGATYDYS